MKTLRIVLLGLMLSAGLVSGAYAHEPRVGVSVQFGAPVYPVYVAPPVYYAPPPMVYMPQPVVVPPYGYGYAGYYGHDHGRHRGWHRHWRHRH